MRLPDVTIERLQIVVPGLQPFRNTCSALRLVGTEVVASNELCRPQAGPTTGAAYELAGQC